jgi:hypothetical protein
MRPFEGEKGEFGVSFEGHAEIGALAAGLEVMIGMVDDPENSAIKEAKAMGTLARDILTVDGNLMSDPLVRAAMGGDNTTSPSVALDIFDAHQLQLANYGLQVAAQAHEDPLLRTVAATTHNEFMQITEGMAD